LLRFENLFLARRWHVLLSSYFNAASIQKNGSQLRSNQLTGWLVRSLGALRRTIRQ